MVLKGMPEKVLQKFQELKKNYPFPIVLRRINGRYYIYKQISKRNRQTGKTEMVESAYLGKITDGGVFVVKGLKNPEEDIEVAKAVIFAHGGTVTLPETPEAKLHATPIGEFTDVDLRILTNLTMNARMPLAFLAGKLGMDPKALDRRIKSLEKRLGIRYVPHIRLEPLGYLQFFIFVKFRGKMPNAERVKLDLKDEPSVQFAAFCNGRYNLVLHVIAKSNNDLSAIIERIKNKNSLINLPSKWYATAFNGTYGFVPFRDEIFRALEKDVWHRTKEKPRPAQYQLLQGEFSVLKELNKDGAVPFAKIEREGNIAVGGGLRAYEKLKDRGILNRVGITMENLPIKYNALIIMEITNHSAFIASRKQLLEYIISEDRNFISSKFSLVGDINLPQGVLFVMPIVADGQLEKEIENLTDKVKGIKVSYLILTDVFLGSILHRRFDNLYSNQYKRLISVYKEAAQKLEEYEPRSTLANRGET